MEVRNIFNAYANGLSKVSLDNTTFLAIQVAGLKEAVRRMEKERIEREDPLNVYDSYDNFVIRLKGSFELPEVVSFLTTRKRFTETGRVSVSQRYFDFFNIGDCPAPTVIYRRYEETDGAIENGGTITAGSYPHGEWIEVIHEDDNIVIFSTGFFGSGNSFACCPVCGNWVSGYSCGGCDGLYSIYCIDKNRQTLDLSEYVPE